MFETMEWKDVYKLWKTGCCYFPQMLSSSVSAERVFVEYKRPLLFVAPRNETTGAGNHGSGFGY